MVVIALITAGAAAAAFGMVELRRSNPMLPLAIFGRAALLAVHLSGFILNFASYGTTFLLSLFVQRTLSPLRLDRGPDVPPPHRPRQRRERRLRPAGGAPRRQGAAALGNAIFAASLAAQT